MAPPGTEATVSSFQLIGPNMSDAEALVAIIRRLSVARTLAEVMEVITHAARSLLEADGITFVLREGDLCYYAEEDSVGPLWKGRRFPMSACISGWCMEHGQAVMIPDIYADPRIPHDAYRPTFVHSLAMAPVRQEEPIAALGAYWSKPRQPTAHELELLQTIANAAALALALVELSEERATRRAREAKGVPEKARERGLLDRLGGSSLARKPQPGHYWKPVLIGLAFAAGAGAVRLALAPLVGGEIPYLPFFVAIPLAVVACGRIAGASAAVAGGLIGYAAFARAPGDYLPEPSQIWGLLAFWAMAALLVIATEAMRGAVAREAATSRRLELVGEELQHRMKNFLTIAQSLALRTARSSNDPDEFERKFGERLQALGTAQALLVKGREARAGLAVLVSQTLGPFRIDGQVELRGGPKVDLDEQLALALALILNELATNAIKYGALSREEGRVVVHWSQAGTRIRLDWCEEGGPPVAAPDKRGFGSRLMKAALPRSRGTVRTDYDPEGLRCSIEFEAPARA